MTTTLIPGKTLGMYKEADHPFYSLVFNTVRTECCRIHEPIVSLRTDYYPGKFIRVAPLELIEWG